MQTRTWTTGQCVRPILSALTMAIATVACSHQAPMLSYEVASREEAAAVTISAIAIPWANISAAVEPNFTITGDTALLQVAPVTSRIQDQIVDALALTAQAGVTHGGATRPDSMSNVSGHSPTSSAGNAGQSTPASGSSGPSTSDAAAPSATKSGDAGTATTSNSASKPASASSSNAPGTGGPAQTSVPPSDPSLDPMLKYQAALALYQEVQLMNNEVQHIAARNCYAPYLVHIKIAILPYRRHLPYDLHARVAFFGQIDPASRATANSGSPNTAPQAASAPTVTSFGFAPHYVPESNSCAPSDDKQPLPQVVPILVTDDVERAVKSRSIESARQIALALSIMAPIAGASGSLSHLQQSLNAVLGQEINSRLTVTRQSDNTIYARIGAAEEPTSGVGLIGQTYDVSVLLLVPKAYFPHAPANQSQTAQIQVVTYSEFRNSVTGAVLPERAPASAAPPYGLDAKTLQDIFPNWASTWESLNSDAKFKVADDLTNAIQQSNFQQFTAGINSISPRVQLSANTVAEIWTRLTELLANSAYGNTTIELHGPDPILFAIPPQPMALIDDGSSSVLQMAGTSGISNGQINARLVLQSPVLVALDAVSIEVDPKSNNNLVVTFPSLKASGISGNAVGGTLVLTPRTCDRVLTLCSAFAGQLPAPTIRSENIPIAYFLKTGTTSAKPNFKLSSAASIVASNNGTGSVIITVSGLTAKSVASVEVSVSGAELRSATAAPGVPIKLSSGKFSLAKAGDVTLNLFNLLPGGSVVISAEGFDANKKSVGKTTLTLPVPLKS
jgi:hypothetical protein